MLMRGSPFGEDLLRASNFGEFFLEAVQPTKLFHSASIEYACTGLVEWSGTLANRRVSSFILLLTDKRTLSCL